MGHSKYYEKIKTYYDEHWWNETKVRNAVDKGYITEEEYEEIVGIKY